MTRRLPPQPDDVECLICRRKMQFLGTHIRRVHGMNASDYRANFDLPASFPLASASYCEQSRRRTNERIAAGSMSYDHLPLAVEQARSAGRGFIATGVRIARSETAAKNRPGDVNRLPDGGKRADGRDANRARKAQQERRARKCKNK